LSTPRTVLRLTDVRKAFGGVLALKGVSLEVRAGEVHALLGENGAGKSTLMAIAAGSLAPDAGDVEIDGAPLTTSSPKAAQALGVGVVYQRPAIAQDLTVLENLVLAMPADRRPSFSRARTWAQERLQRSGARIDPLRRATELNAAEQQLVEIAKALALDPRVLILDEPTAALSAAEVSHLFDQLRAIRAAGTAIVYISHRIPEITEIADRLTVLRDGENRGTFPIAEVSEDDILALIVGRELSAMFPDKPAGAAGEPLLEFRGLSGESFDDVTLTVHAGEIVGLAGVAGNGQRELLRAAAGLESHDGEVAVGGATVKAGDPVAAQRAGIGYVPADRHREGLFESLTVRENIVANALQEHSRHGFVVRSEEQRAAVAELERLAVRTSSPEAPVTTLSGGNQQKVVFGRALMSEPAVLLCDEPTQGVDVGARAEIYRLLRGHAAEGKAIVVCSSDALELEGLCDRVVIMSRGHAVVSLGGDEVTEERITGAAVTATQSRRELTARAAATGRGGVARFLRGDNVAVPVIAVVIALLAAYTGARNGDFLGSFNLSNLLLLATALMLVSIGQLIVLVTGGVDLSVGPMMGLGVVILTAFATDEKGTGGLIVGLALLVAAGLGVGLVNGSLVRFARIPPLIATLATFIAVQGVGLLINPVPEGLLAANVSDKLSKTIGDLLPIVFVVVLAIALGCEWLLRRSRLGLALRAVGSDEASAHRIGVGVGRTLLVAYALCGLFAALAAIMLAVQIGTGDAQAGQNYTLQSIAAVVLGGASIYGGRGSVIGAILGALLLSELIAALPFLQLGDQWQFWLPGATVLVAAAIYARASGTRLAAVDAEA
jgi:ribose transport system permease protein/ribose transport system ATP-binding protein